MVAEVVAQTNATVIAQRRVTRGRRPEEPFAVTCAYCGRVTLARRRSRIYCDGNCRKRASLARQQSRECS